MSKIGKKPVIIPDGVQIGQTANTLTFKGTLGEVSLTLPEGIKAVVSEKEILLQRVSDAKKVKSVHGTYARLVQNSIIGVTAGFQKVLEIVGTGYRAVMEGETLVLSLGFSHQIKLPSPEGIKLSVEENNRVKVFGLDKDKVGVAAHKIKMFKKPDSYKGKGIRYLGEKLRLKPGKAAAKTGVAK